MVSPAQKEARAGSERAISNFVLSMSPLGGQSGVMTDAADWQGLERSLGEPEVPDPADITSLEGLTELPTMMVKLTYDRGRTWSYHLLTGDLFLHYTGEIRARTYPEHAPTSSLPALSLSDQYFASGAVARPVTQGEAIECEFNRSLRPRIEGHGLNRARLLELQTVRDGVGLPEEVSDGSRFAAKWWADHLEIVRTGARRSRASDPALAVTEDSLKAFEADLARRIEALDPGEFTGKVIGTTHEPDLILGLATARAGLPLSVLPWHTKMVVSPKFIGVEGTVVWRNPASGPSPHAIIA